MHRKSLNPLAAHLAHRRITKAQYLAAEEFRRLYALAPEQADAAMALAMINVTLGEAGAALLRDALIQPTTVRQIAASRGLKGRDWERFYAKRLALTLDELAVAFGFKPAQTPAPPSAPRAR